MLSDVSILLVVLNAAVDSPTMLALFPHHLASHYTCLRNTLPHMVPALPVSCHSTGGQHTTAVYGLLGLFTLPLVWRSRGNIIRTALCWVVWHSVHSQQQTYTWDVKPCSINVFAACRSFCMSRSIWTFQCILE